MKRISEVVDIMRLVTAVVVGYQRRRHYPPLRFGLT